MHKDSKAFAYDFMRGDIKNGDVEVDGVRNDVYLTKLDKNHTVQSIRDRLGLVSSAKKKLRFKTYTMLYC